MDREVRLRGDAKLVQQCIKRSGGYGLRAPKKKGGELASSPLQCAECGKQPHLVPEKEASSNRPMF